MTGYRGPDPSGLEQKLLEIPPVTALFAFHEKVSQGPHLRIVDEQPVLAARKIGFRATQKQLSQRDQPATTDGIAKRVIALQVGP